MDLNEGFDDLFDSINNLRTVSYEKGLKEGEINGKKESIFSGFKTGITYSVNINRELGYYFGICDHYKEIKKQSNGSEIRAFNLSILICDLITKIDISNPHDENLVNNLEHIRDKFKQFSSLTNFKSDFNKQPTKDENAFKDQAMRMNF